MEVCERESMGLDVSGQEEERGRGRTGWEREAGDTFKYWAAMFSGTALGSLSGPPGLLSVDLRGQWAPEDASLGVRVRVIHVSVQSGHRALCLHCGEHVVYCASKQLSGSGFRYPSCPAQP